MQNKLENQKETKSVTTPEFDRIGHEIGLLVKEKNAAYGDSFNHSGKIMEFLFPNGIPPEKYTIALALVRILDKIFRLATNPSYNNENCWGDIAGYCILMLGYEQQKKDTELVETFTKGMIDLVSTPHIYPAETLNQIVKTEPIKDNPVKAIRVGRIPPNMEYSSDDDRTFYYDSCRNGWVEVNPVLPGIPAEAPKTFNPNSWESKLNTNEINSPELIDSGLGG